jgi:peptidoglycan/xylan/chitin deacetylase (PgdA/CDA1 family)
MKPCRLFSMLTLAQVSLSNVFADGLQPNPPVVQYQGRLSVALPFLDHSFGMSSERPIVAARTTKVSLGGKAWEFLNGGDQVQLPTGIIQEVDHPLLVLGGVLYLDGAEANKLFGIEVKADQIQLGNVVINTTSSVLESKYHGHKIDSLTICNELITLNSSLELAQSFHDGDSLVRLNAGKKLLVRRRAIIDGKNWSIVTDCGANPATYAVESTKLHDASSSAGVEKTTWDNRKQWFRQAATKSLALNRSQKPPATRCSALTIDLCWSNRQYEKDLFSWIADQSKSGVAITLFVSGRWLQQHPQEMESLINLGKIKGISLLWGLHSWTHPKSGRFMNDFAEKEIVEDTLKLELKLLEWGILPTVYYRFPGLIHDEKRISTILEMNLLPIDADAWIAVQSEKHKHGGPVQPGSIILVHGNGNEPQGVSKFLKWWQDNPGWRLIELHELLP